MPPSKCSERIDFISEYCDRWCERCAFTLRCSATSDDDAWRATAELTQLNSQVETAFPDARRFRRPGFDTLAGR